MAPTLYLDEVSPPVRSVLLTIEALGIKVEQVHIDLLKEEQLSEEFIKKNPQHTLPTLEDEGSIISNSHAINAYLVDRYGKNDSLYPKDLKQRAIVNQRLFFDDGILFPAIRGIARPILREGVKEIPQEKIDAAYSGYDIVEAFLKTSPWIAGDRVTIADFGIFASLTALDTFVPITAQKYPRIQAWLKRVQELPYYPINQPGDKAFKDIFKKLLSK